MRCLSPAPSFHRSQAEEDPFEDKYGEPEVMVDMSIVKNKSFPMPAIGVEEAVMCLDYIGHDCELFVPAYVPAVPQNALTWQYKYILWCPICSGYST